MSLPNGSELPPSNKEQVRTLCKSIITRLENQGAIAFPPRLRQIVAEEVYGLVGPYIMTDEDIREKALAKVGARRELLEDSQFTEGDSFKTAKALVKSSLGDDVLNGFYFQKPIKHVATSIVQYLMRSSNIDEVYEQDEVLEKQIVETVQKFNPVNAH